VARTVTIASKPLGRAEIGASGVCGAPIVIYPAISKTDRCRDQDGRALAAAGGEGRVLINNAVLARRCRIKIDCAEQTPGIIMVEHQRHAELSPAVFG